MTEQLAAQGHRVFVSGRNIKALDQLVEKSRGNITAIPCDISDDKAMAGLFSEKDIASLDTIILCAGTCEYIDMPLLDINKIRRVADTNYFGVVNSCIAALPLLKKSSLGPHIIGIGSMSSYVGFPRAEAYGSSKAAMSYFLESLRTDLDREVDVTVVYPGFIKTPMTEQNDFPMPFLMTADKAAETILNKAEKHPLTIAFPSRLHLLLQTMKLFPRLWYSVIAAKISRYQAANT